jgi:hypothetical protein
VCIKDDFKQFLPHIIPQLLKDAQRDVDFQVKSTDDFENDEPEEKTGYKSLNLKVKGLEGAQ